MKYYRLPIGTAIKRIRSKPLDDLGLFKWEDFVTTKDVQYSESELKAAALPGTGLRSGPRIKYRMHMAGYTNSEFMYMTFWSNQLCLT